MYQNIFIYNVVVIETVNLLFTSLDLSKVHPDLGVPEIWAKKIVLIGQKQDKSGTFQIRSQYILAQRSDLNQILSHLRPISPTLEPNLTYLIDSLVWVFPCYKQTHLFGSSPAMKQRTPLNFPLCVGVTQKVYAPVWFGKTATVSCPVRKLTSLSTCQNQTGNSCQQNKFLFTHNK